MRKTIYVLLFLLFCSARASAQFTTVTGTVTDTNNLPYSCGTITATLINNNGISATLNGSVIQGFTSPVKLGCPGDPTTPSTQGAFQMQLADNTLVKCGIAVCGIQTTWQFTINGPTNNFPPLGTGPQTCTVSATISGSSQSITNILGSCPALTRLSSVSGVAGTGALTTIPATMGDSATGAALTTSEVRYITIPFSCTIKGWHIAADAGTVTIKVAKVSGGTAVPTLGANSISTSGVSLSTGTKIDSIVLTDFTTTTIFSGDTLGYFITAVATAKQVTFQLDCQ